MQTAFHKNCLMSSICRQGLDVGSAYNMVTTGAICAGRNTCQKVGGIPVILAPGYSDCLSTIKTSTAEKETDFSRRSTDKIRALLKCKLVVCYFRLFKRCWSMFILYWSLRHNITYSYSFTVNDQKKVEYILIFFVNLTYTFTLFFDECVFHTLYHGYKII